MGTDQKALLAQAQRYIEQWNCHPAGTPFFTPSSLLWPLRRSRQSLMLKIAVQPEAQGHGSDMLTLYQGEGAIRVAALDGPVQLLERAQLDSTLSLAEMVKRGEDDAASHIICDVIDRLHLAAATVKRPLRLVPFAALSEGMTRYIDTGQVQVFDQPLFDVAREVAADLAGEDADSLPLHGDLHHENILHCAERGWLAIDPKGVAGPRAAEYAVMLCHPRVQPDVVSAGNRMDRQASIVAKRAGVDRARILKFTFLHAMQAASRSQPAQAQLQWLACARMAGRLAGLKMPVRVG